LRTELFDFQLPNALIAQAPLPDRDGARLLHVAETLSDRQVCDVPSLLRAGDVLVLNQSKVIPARLFAEVGGKPIEVLLHQPVSTGSNVWQAFAKPARKLKEGMQVHFADDFSARVEGRTADGQVILRFECDVPTLFQKLHVHGHMPLPPYIARGDDAADKTRYQTVFAREEGSVAAPTAGLHFTPELLHAVEARGVQIAYVTLHVGAGTFQPVKVDDTTKHVMHREWFEIAADAATTINTARAAGGRVVAVGTTSMRTLESAAADDGTLHACSGDTDIFITPGYRFKIVDVLMTNFHLPKSTLFMLVSAFSGLERMQAAYAHAIQHQYRFYSYGDACWLERA
jgi:S-adenosylmethionine:tRNA ribosyltransferase-isomerase